MRYSAYKHYNITTFRTKMGPQSVLTTFKAMAYRNSVGSERNEERCWGLVIVIIAEPMVAVEADGKNMKRPRTGGLGIYIHQLFDDYTEANYEVEPEVPLLLLGTVLLRIPLHLSRAARSGVNFSLYLLQLLHSRYSSDTLQQAEPASRLWSTYFGRVFLAKNTISQVTWPRLTCETAHTS